MLETLKLGAKAFLFLALALIIDFSVLAGTISGPIIVLVAVLAAVMILLIWLVGYSCRHDRQRLVDIFGGSVKLLLVLVAVFVFIQGCILVLIGIAVLRPNGGALRVELVIGTCAFV